MVGEFWHRHLSSASTEVALDTKMVLPFLYKAQLLPVLLISSIFSLKKSHEVSMLVLPKMEVCRQKTVQKGLLMRFFSEYNI